MSNNCDKNSERGGGTNNENNGKNCHIVNSMKT